jgi:hypothetical protein
MCAAARAFKQSAPPQLRISLKRAVDARVGVEQWRRRWNGLRLHNLLLLAMQ